MAMNQHDRPRDPRAGPITAPEQGYAADLVERPLKYRDMVDLRADIAVRVTEMGYEAAFPTPTDSLWQGSSRKGCSVRSFTLAELHQIARALLAQADRDPFVDDSRYGPASRESVAHWSGVKTVLAIGRLIDDEDLIANPGETGSSGKARSLRRGHLKTLHRALDAQTYDWNGLHEFKPDD